MTSIPSTVQNLVFMICLTGSTVALARNEVRSVQPAPSGIIEDTQPNTTSYPQDRLVNPPLEHPPINGPTFNSGSSALLRYYENQRFVEQPVVQQVPADNPGFIRRAYDATIGPYVSQYVTPYVQPVVQPVVEYGSRAANATVEYGRQFYQWSIDQLRGIAASLSIAQRTRRNGDCQAIGGTRPTFPRAGMCCKAAVNDVLVSREVIPRRIRSNFAKDSIPDIRSMRNSRGKLIFKDITNEIGRDTSRAPLMTVLVYGGPGPGHMEVRTERGYESDFVGAEGIDKRRRDRPLIGAFAIVDPERR